MFSNEQEKSPENDEHSQVDVYYLKPVDRVEIRQPRI